VEFAFAFGSGARARAEKMIILSTGLAVGVCLLAGPIVVLGGPWIVGFATKGKLHPPLPLLGLMWGALFAYACCVAFHIALIASNRSHAALAKLALWAAVSGGLTYLLGRSTGLYGVTLGLLLFQIGFSIIVIGTAMKVFDLRFAGMARQMRSLDAPAAIMRLARGATGRE
jgi:O-antigen/teichoic acid export membrane protein